MFKKVLLILVVLLGISKFSNAQWTSDTTLNTAVRAASGMSIYTPLLASGNNGSTYFCYFENVNGNYEMHMQVLDSAGNKMWAPNGIAVSTFPQSSAVYRYDMAVDNNGDAIVAFQDIRSSGNLNIVVYKVEKNGTLPWGSSGIQLIDSTGTQGLSPKIGICPNNDVIVAWNASGSGSSKWIAFHKITASGQLAWTSVHRIKVGTNKYSRPNVIPIVGDEFLIQYVQEVGNFPGVTSTMYLDKFNPNGISSLANPIKVSDKTIPFFTYPRPVFDGNNGIYLSFQTSNPSNPTINDTYVQHVTATGYKWSLDGSQAGNSSSTHKYPAGPAIHNSNSNETWALLQVQNSSQSASGVYVQKFDSIGNSLLGANAKLVLPIVSDMSVPMDWQMTTNGLIFFYKSGSFNNEKLRAVKIDFSGNTVWSTPIISLAGTSSNKSSVACGKFANNQLVLGWLDDRTTAGVYAQNISNDGNIGVLSGIKNTNDFQQCSIVENPSSELRLFLGSNWDEKWHFDIYSASGSLMLSKSLFSGNNSTLVSLSTETFPKGIYFIHAQTKFYSTTKTWVKN